MRRLALIFALSGCAADDPPPPTAQCEALTCATEAPCDQLFGQPSPRTGLPEGRCAPTCTCAGARWLPGPYDADLLADLRAHVLLDPPGPLTADPYASASPPTARPEAACGAHFEADGYRLTTYDSPSAARTAGAIVTHHGACGRCSSLQDLAIYIGTPDLTEPVRSCGIMGITQGAEAQRACILDLGFSPACADIWSFNTSNTRQACGAVCLPLIDAPHHTADGAPNACITCDEEQSGPVFKAVAGRTRRNSGLPTALCRPCESVAPVTHAYPAPP